MKRRLNIPYVYISKTDGFRIVHLIENGWGWEQVCLKKEKEKKRKKKSIKMVEKSIDGKVCCSFVLTI